MPPRSTATLPTIACVVEVMIRPSAKPISRNQGHNDP